jgi:hypothetical protein
MTVSLRSALVGLALLAPGIFISIARGAAPDAGLYTGYYLSSDYTGVTFIVCGSVPGSDGCYGFGTLGPFGHVGAMVEGNGKIVGSVVNHDIYVVDVAGGASGKEVILNSYTLTGGAWFLVPTTQGISSKDVPTLLGSEPADTRLSIQLRPATTSP